MALETNPTRRPSFWKTLPGILTGSAALSNTMTRRESVGTRQRARNRERGSMSTGTPLAIIAIIAVIILSKFDSLDSPGGYAVAGLVAAAFTWLAWMMGALPFVDTALRASLARRMAKRLDGTISKVEQRIWGGGTATAYGVEWNGPRCRFQLEFDVTGTLLRGHVPGGQGAEGDLARETMR